MFAQSPYPAISLTFLIPDNFDNCGICMDFLYRKINNACRTTQKMFVTLLEVQSWTSQKSIHR